MRAECSVCPTRARACPTHTDTRAGVSDTHAAGCLSGGACRGFDAQRVDDARAVPRKWDEVVRSFQETCPVSTGGGTRRVQSVRKGGGGGAFQETVQRARLGEP